MGRVGEAPWSLTASNRGWGVCPASAAGLNAADSAFLISVFFSCSAGDSGDYCAAIE